MNRMSFIGNLTRDPESRTTPSGVSLCSFSVAVNGRNKTDANGQQTQDVQFFQVTAWRQLGENCQKYLKKGRKVYVSGPLAANTYTANDGTTRVSLNVTADDVEFLSSNENGSQGNSASSSPADPHNGFEPVEATDDLPF